MPSLIGLSLTETTKICSALKLRIEIIQEKEDPTVPAETVVYQIPSSGQQIKNKQTVFIAITKQKPAHTVPDLIGLSKEQIEAICASIELKPKFYDLIYTFPKGQCFAQYPMKGAVADSTVICYLATEEEQYALWPNFKGKLLKDVSEATATLGISMQTNVTPKPGRTYYIIDQQPKAGASIDMQRIDQMSVYFHISTKKPHF